MQINLKKWIISAAVLGFSAGAGFAIAFLITQA
jgi:hypothetical protein